MINYVAISLESIKAKAFHTDTEGGKALLLQDILIRMKSIKKEEGLVDSNFVFLQNPKTGIIKMEIV